MSKPSRSGVRGLFKELRYFDAAGKLVRKADALARIKAGEKLAKEERYYIDLRWKDPKTGKQDRHTERLPDNISATAAKTRALEIMNSAKAGTFEKDREPPKTVADALAEYEIWAETNRTGSFKTKKSLCKILKAKLGHHCLDELSSFDIERFKRDRDKEGAGPATINRAVAQLKHMYTMAKTWGWASAIDRARIHEVSKLKETPGRVRCLSQDEEGKLFGKLEGTMLAIVTTADLTAMRREECVRLRKDAVDLQRCKLTLRKTKTNRVRILDVEPPLAAVLKAALALSPEESEYVFVQQTGRNKGKPYALASVSQHFRRTKNALGIKDLTLHDIRHDTATKMRRAGVGIDVISKVLGHSQITTTTRYAHVGTDLLRHAMASVPAPIARPLPDGLREGTEDSAEKETQLA